MAKTTKSAPTKTIDEYLSDYPEDVRVALEKLRQIIRDLVPEAEEMVNYGIPGFKYHGNLVYFGAYKNHLSFFVGNGSLIKKMGDELKKYETTTSAIHFTIEKPLPLALIKKIVKLRIKENIEIEQKRLAKKKNR